MSCELNSKERNHRKTLQNPNHIYSKTRTIPIIIKAITQTHGPTTQLSN